MKNILNIIKGIAQNHANIASVSDGDIYEQLNGDANIEYPRFNIDVLDSNIEDHTITHNFRIYVVDRIDDGNEINIQSDTFNVIEDIVRTFALTKFVVTPGVVTPFIQKFNDLTAGSYVDLTVKIGSQYNTCNSPTNFDGTIVDASAYVVDYSIAGILNRLANFIPDVSLNDTYFKWNSGLLEPSIGGAFDMAAAIHAATNKPTPIDADEVGIWDSITGLLNRLSWANIKATLGTGLAFLSSAITIKGSSTGKTALASANASASDYTATFPAKNITVAGLDDIITSRLQSYSTTATAAGTTTFTVASNYMQYFTGTANQTIVMPDVTTLVLGFQFKIINDSTGILTINSSGGNLIISLAAGCEITLTCILITGTGAASWDKLAESINLPATEKIVSALTTGLQVSYDIQAQIIAPGTIASAVWTTGIATYTGLQGQLTFDANYAYTCISTNTWIRQPNVEARYDMWLADINDSSGDQTSTDLDTAYPSAIIGQWVYGTVRNIYYKHATNDWGRIPRNITTDNTYIPERLADITGVANGYQLSIKAGYDIKSIRAVAETTTAGNITIGSTGTAEVSNLEVTAACSSNGNVDIVLGGVTFTKALTTASNTPTLVATALRAMSFAGYVTGGSGVNVTFTSIYAKTETDATYSAGTTGAAGTMTTATQGVDPNSDIVTSVALPTTVGVGLRLTYIEDPLFPTAASRVVYVAISSAATIKLQIILERIY